MTLRHSYYRRMLPLFLYGELTDQERQDLEQHLGMCESCRREIDGTRRLHSLLARVPWPAPPEAQLQEARLQFRAALASERRQPRTGRLIAGLLGAFQPLRPAHVFTGLVLVAAAFIAGRTLFPAGGSQIPATAGLAQGELRVTNLQLVGDAGSDGMIDVAFDAVRPMRIRGNLNDPAIQKVLAYAVVNGENPGVRLRAAGSVSAMQSAPPEREVRAALMLAMTSDRNDGVRREALRALLRYPGDREVRDAVLTMILHDPNPGLRVAAINALDTLRARGYQPDQGQLQTIRQIRQNDQSLYVRTKAQSILGEKIQ